MERFLCKMRKYSIKTGVNSDPALPLKLVIVCFDGESISLLGVITIYHNRHSLVAKLN